MRSQEEAAFFLLHPGAARLLGNSSSSFQSGATQRTKLCSPLQQVCLLLPPPLWSWWERAFPWNEEGGTVAAITVITSKTPSLPFGLGVITLRSPGKPCPGEQQQQQQSEAPCTETPLGLKGDGDGALKLHCVSPRTQKSFKERGLITLKYPKWSRIQKCCNQNKPHRFWLFQPKPKFSFCRKVCYLREKNQLKTDTQSNPSAMSRSELSCGLKK